MFKSSLVLVTLILGGCAVPDSYRAQYVPRESGHMVVGNPGPTPVQKQIVFDDPPPNLTARDDATIGLVPDDNNSPHVANCTCNGEGRLVGMTTPKADWGPTGPSLQIIRGKQFQMSNCSSDVQSEMQDICKSWCHDGSSPIFHTTCSL